MVIWPTTLTKMASVSRERTDDGVDGRDGLTKLLARESDELLFFAGCSEEQGALPFDYRVLLTAPTPVLVHRLRTRTGNGYGRDGAELSQVLADLAEVEPLLRRSADLGSPQRERRHRSPMCCLRASR